MEAAALNARTPPTARISWLPNIVAIKARVAFSKLKGNASNMKCAMPEKICDVFGKAWRARARNGGATAAPAVYIRQ